MNVRKPADPEMLVIPNAIAAPKSRTVTIKEPRQDRSEFTLKCVVEAARAEILKAGARASLRDIATRAGVAASTVSERFATRETLLEYVHDDDCQRLEKRLDMAIADLLGRGHGPRALVHAAIEEGLLATRHNASMAMAMHELARAYPEIARRRVSLIQAQLDKIIAASKAHYGQAWTDATTRVAQHAAHVVTSSALIGASYSAFGANNLSAGSEVARQFADMLIATLDLPADLEPAMDKALSNEYSSEQRPSRGAADGDEHETQKGSERTSE